MHCLGSVLSCVVKVMRCSVLVLFGDERFRSVL